MADIPVVFGESSSIKTFWVGIAASSAARASVNRSDDLDFSIASCAARTQCCGQKIGLPCRYDGTGALMNWRALTPVAPARSWSTVASLPGQRVIEHVDVDTV
jgi:hypothetical protein